MFPKRSSYVLPLLILPILVAGCAGEGHEDLRNAATAPEAGLYQGDASFTYASGTGDGQYVSAAYVYSDGRVRLFGVPRDENTPFGLLSYALTAGGIERREGQVVVRGVPGTAESTALGSSPLRLELVGSSFNFGARLTKRAFPQVGTTFDYRSGTYKGRIIFLQADGSLAAFGTATATLAGAKLLGEMTYSGVENVYGVAGQFGADLQAGGATTGQAVIFGGLVSDDTITYSATSSRILVRIVNREGDTTAWIELDRQ